MNGFWVEFAKQIAIDIKKTTPKGSKWATECENFAFDHKLGSFSMQSLAVRGGGNSVSDLRHRVRDVGNMSRLGNEGRVHDLIIQWT